MLVTPAYAQDAVGAGSAFASFVPLILIFLIMYFLLIRPQQKKLKEHQAMVAALRRGDQVVTGGGLVGKVVRVKDDGSNEVEVEIADGVKVRVIKHTITQVLSKTEPAAG
jgi:preprotein translocase subunit YajC